MGALLQARPWPDLPGRFLLPGLLWVVAVEVVGTHWMGDGNPTMPLIGMRLAEIAGLLLLAARMRLLTALGLERPGREQWRVFVLVTVISGLGFLLLAGIGHLMHVPVMRYFGAPSWIQGTAGLMLMLVLAPLAEELFFRGLVYRLFRQAFGMWPGLVLSAICFALMHGQLLSPQLAGGMIFAVAYEWGRNLWVAVWLHAGANAAILLLNL